MLLSYQASTLSAKDIAARLKGAAAAGNGATFVLVTNSDISSIAQLRIVLGQASIIASRLKTTTATLFNFGQRCGAVPPAGPKGAIPPAIANIGTFILANPSTVQTLVQTIASMAAVNETATPGTGALGDASLINLVANNMAPAPVIVPSVYPPALITTEFDQTAIGTAVRSLEASNATMQGAAAFVLTYDNCTKDKFAPINQALTSQVSALSQVVYGFESSLFTGQVTLPAPSMGNGGGNGNGTTGGGQNPQNNPPGNGPGGGGPQGSGQTTPGFSGSLLAQLLYADLLISQLNKPALMPVPNVPAAFKSVVPAIPPELDPAVAANGVPATKLVYFLVAIHSLESGGTTLTKSSWLGSRIYYSGGAVATYTIFKDDGKFLCSGLSYGYRGFVQDKDIGSAALPDQRLAHAKDNALSILPDTTTDTGLQTGAPTNPRCQQ